MTVKEIPVNIRCLEYRQDKTDTESQTSNAVSTQNKHAITRGADYYRR